MQIDIPGGLRDLGRLVDRIAELLEWQKLAQQERRLPFPTSFEWNDHLDQDISDLRATFTGADMSLRTLLSRSDLNGTREQRHAWQRHLEQIEQRLAALSATDTFNNP